MLGSGVLARGVKNLNMRWEKPGGTAKEPANREAKIFVASVLRPSRPPVLL